MGSNVKLTPLLVVSADFAGTVYDETEIVQSFIFQGFLMAHYITRVAQLPQCHL